MIKKEFSISCANDGSVTLSENPFFNKMESGVTKLSFVLPELEGYAYLLCRHDRKEWYAIPILNDDGFYVFVGQTVTAKHGRWAFNVCVCEKELINVDQQDGVIYMSDVFEGLVYDNIADKTPAAMEPNVLRLGNDFKVLYDELKAKQDIIDDDLDRAEGAVVNLESTVNQARAYMTAAGEKADEASESATSAEESAQTATDKAAECAEAVAQAERWARDSFISSEVCREQLSAIGAKVEQAEECVVNANDAADRAEEAAKQSQQLAGANDIRYDSQTKEVVLLNQNLVLASAKITDITRIDETESDISDCQNDIAITNVRLSNLYEDVVALTNLVGTYNSMLAQLI